MTGDVIDIAERRRERSSAKQRSRLPDIEIAAWVENGEIDGVCLTSVLLDEWLPHQQVAALLDVAWVWGMRDDAPPAERPVLWILLDGSGRQCTVVASDTFRNSTWRHGWWLIKRWWWLTRKCWLYAYRASRGRG
jgi:hypothetical protein